MFQLGHSRAKSHETFVDLDQGGLQTFGLGDAFTSLALSTRQSLGCRGERRVVRIESALNILFAGPG